MKRKTTETMKEDNIVVSVGRQFGCKGRVIGREVADRFGFDFYDAELINLAAKEIGFDPEFFAKADEKPSLPRFFQNVGQIMFGGDITGDDNYLSNGKMFEIQSEVIKQKADEGPCVFMGRCSDYVLRHNARLFSVFFAAPIDFRIQCVKERSGIDDEDKVRQLIEKTDKKRAAYYSYYTDKVWGHSSSYNMCIDVTQVGGERTADYVCDFLATRFPELKNHYK